jgi:hypothetical protein
MKQKIIKYGILVFVLVLIYFGYSIYHGGKVRGAFTEKDLSPASFEPGNGFYLFLALPEPPGVDIHSSQVIDKYRAIYDPGFKKKISPNQTAPNRVFLPGTRDHRGSYAKILKIMERDHFFGGLYSGERKKILSFKKELSFLLERYWRMINVEIFEDFTGPDFDLVSFPYEPYMCASGLFLAVNVCDALEGKCETAVENILKQMVFLKKFLKTARHNHYDISMYILTSVILDLGRLIDRESCPPSLFSRVLKEMPPLSNLDFLSGNALISFYLFFANYLDNQPFWKIYLQKERAKQYYVDYCRALTAYERECPYQRKSSWSDVFRKIRSQRKKILFFGVDSLLENFHITRIEFPHFFQSTYRTRVLYDLVRLSAELRLKYDPGKTIAENLESLDSYKRIDEPYKYSRERKVLYSFGRDCKDNNGAVSFNATKPSDIAVPCRIHHKN